MKKISLNQFKDSIHHGNKNFSNIILENINLEYFDLSNMDFSYSNFINVNLKGVNFTNSNLENSLLDDCNLEEVKFVNANLQNASMRRANLRSSNISGANLYASILEDAQLENIIYNENTKFFQLYCPEKGAFFAYKKALNNRLIKLLIPGDAKRVSATRNCCRCDKAKVLEISDFENKKYYDEAWSTVAEDFCYKLGEWVYAENFNEDRWYDSTGGIHFWMTREEAKKY